MLDKYLEENKSDICPHIYKAFKQKVQAYQKRRKDTQVSSVDEYSTNESHWNRALNDFRLLRYRYESNPPGCFSDTLSDMDDLLFSVNELSVNSLTKQATIPGFSPTYIRACTSEKTTTLFRLLQFMKRGDWNFVQKYLPSKTLKQVRYKAKALQPVEPRALEPSKALEIPFNRDLRPSRIYRSTLDLAQDFLSDFESELCDSLNAQLFYFSRLHLSSGYS